MLQYLGQGVVYALIAALLGVFASAPSYTRFPEDQGQLTLNLAHSGKHLGECRRLSAQEIAKLPPKQRRPLDCDRGRQPVLIEIEFDGNILIREALPPTGLFGDGPSQLYRNFSVPAGRHRLAARLRDSGRSDGFDYARDQAIDIRPRQRLVIEFRAEAGGFHFAGGSRLNPAIAQAAEARP
jgi:hypothetical protein